MAVRHGLLLAHRDFFMQIVVESDCSPAILLIVSRSQYGRLSSHLLASDIAELGNQLAECVFSFAPRKCNKVAHAMARIVLDWIEDSVFLPDASSCLAFLVLADVSNYSFSP